MGFVGSAVLEQAAWASCFLSSSWQKCRPASERVSTLATRKLVKEVLAHEVGVHAKGWTDARFELESIRHAALAATADANDGLTRQPRGSSGAPDLPLDERLLVIWDSADARCAAVACELRCEYGAFCVFVDFHDKIGLALALARHPGVPSHIVCRASGISAVLPSGICISECERHPKVLLYELRYLVTLRLPDEEAVAARDRRWFAPLRSLRDQSAALRGAGQSGRTDNEPWWLCQQALKLISGSLEVNGFAVVDGFLPEHDIMDLREAVRSLYDDGSMVSGLSEQATSHGGFWGPTNDGDYMNHAGEARKWTLHGDFRAWCSDEDPRVGKSFQKHTRWLDHLVNLLKKDAIGAETSKRMRDVDFHEYIMAVCYPGETRSRYLRHCDVSRGAVLTTILYLNPDWRKEDGGCLRLYWPGEKSGQRVKQDILPVAGRLLLFWASEEVPHEVLATKRDRFTISIWYKTGRDALKGANWLPDLLLRHQPVSPLTLSEALRRAGTDAATIKQVDWLNGLLAQEVEEAGKVAILRSVLQTGGLLEARPESFQGTCAQCGRADEGRFGIDDYIGQFFCTQCWHSWLMAPASPLGGAAEGARGGGAVDADQLAMTMGLDEVAGPASQSRLAFVTAA